MFSSTRDIEVKAIDKTPCIQTAYGPGLKRTMALGQDKS